MLYLLYSFCIISLMSIVALFEIFIIKRNLTHWNDLQIFLMFLFPILFVILSILLEIKF